MVMVVTQYQVPKKDPPVLSITLYRHGAFHLLPVES